MEEEEEGPLRKEISHSPCHPYLPSPQGQWQELRVGVNCSDKDASKKSFFFANCDFNKVGKFVKNSWTKLSQADFLLIFLTVKNLFWDHFSPCPPCLGSNIPSLFA